ncbi:MAG: LCP family protein [Anaerolineales bacterium]|jgi:LCP family protein required for cell wall assembly
MEHNNRIKTKSRSVSNPNLLLLGLVVAFVIIAIITALATFNFVRNFVASWDITDLPGIVVKSRATATSNNPVGIVPTVEDQPSLQPAAAPTPGPWDGASRVTVLIMGLDYRDWEAGEGAPRTDTMMLLSVDPLTNTAGMLSIPRDLWVNIPGFEPNRINTAYRFGEIYDMPGGGPGLAMKTVEELLGLKIDFYAQVDFSAFEQFIDEIGGVKIDIPHRIKLDPIDGDWKVLKAGVQVLPGNLALAYARARYTKGGDFDRAQRQQQVIMGIRNRILEEETLLRLIRNAPILYDELSSGVHTNMTLDQAVKLSWMASKVPEENIKRGIIGTQQVTLNKSPEGDDVLKPRPEQIRILRDEVFTAAGPVSPAAADADPQDLMKEEGASITVFNGSNTPGLASRTTDYLKSEGVNVMEPADAQEPYSYTTLISYTGKPYTIKYLMDLMDISPNRLYLRYDPSSQVDMVLFLGYDWANNNSMP